MEIEQPSPQTKERLTSSVMITHSGQWARKWEGLMLTLQVRNMYTKNLLNLCWTAPSEDITHVSLLMGRQALGNLTGELPSLAKATPLDPQHRMYYITGTQRKGLVYMPYATCSHFRILSYQSAASTSFCVIFCGAHR